VRGHTLTAVLTAVLLVASVAGAAGPGAAQGPVEYEPCEFPVTMTDATGEEITLEEPPERVTTTNPSAAQTMWEIGGREQVVGLTQYALYLDGADERANVSASFGVDTERVVATEPDLVLAPNASAGDVEALRDAGLTVYHFPEEQTIGSIREKTTIIGRLTGNCEGAAETNAWMDANVAAIEGTTGDVPAADRPTVLYPLGAGFAAGNGTFINDMMVTAGADNIAADEFDWYEQLSEEVIVEEDPDYIVIVERNRDVLDEEPYASTTAVREDQVIVLPVQYVNQPAPRSVVRTTHNLTAAFHPDRYDEDAYVPRSAVDVEPADGATPTPEPTAGPTPTPDDAGGDEATASTAEPSPTPEPAVDPVPGFGPAVALVALVAAGLLAGRGRP